MTGQSTGADAPRPSTDVLIVGAGPTGLTMANLLGRYGVRCVLLERNAATVDEPRAVSIDDESLRTMQAIDLSATLEQVISQGYGSKYYSPSGRAFALVDPQSREYGFDKRNGFQQPELEQILRDGLNRFAHVKTMFAAEMLSFVQSHGGVTARVRTGEGESKIRARYLVACDGARSTTRKALGFDLEGSTFKERWLIVDLFRTENTYRHTEVFCDPRRPGITLPGPGGIRRYEFMLHDNESEADVTAEPFVRSLLTSVGPDSQAPLRRVRVYAFHARVATGWRQGNVFLAGDAAHLSPPFAGQGMNSGVRDAHNLAWKLASALRGHGDEQLLNSYEDERRPHVTEMIQLALNMGRVMMPKSALQGFAIRQIFRLLGVYPPARDYIAQMKYKPKPRFRRGIMWPDGRPAQESLIGQLFPQPIVENAARQRGPLDDALGLGWSLLIFSEDPARAMQTLPPEDAALCRRIGITPAHVNPPMGEERIVRDVSRMLSTAKFSRYLEHAILLRPDRYVAASAPLSDFSQLEPSLQWLARSMGSAPDVAPAAH